VPEIVLDGGTGTLKAVEPSGERLAEADCIVIATDHREFDYRRIVEVARLVVDTRGVTRDIDAPAERLVRL
jgi:UDP-N-acetyl-D-glucosamine dehydrogenase